MNREEVETQLRGYPWVVVCLHGRRFPALSSGLDVDDDGLLLIDEYGNVEHEYRFADIDSIIGCASSDEEMEGF